MSKDTLYSQAHDRLAPFEFDEQVARVFPDMIKRSVPGYSHIILNIGVLAGQYAQPNSRLYDLGSSLGAASVAMRHRVQAPGVEIVAIDNSAAMLQRSRDFLDTEESDIPVITQCADIRNVDISNASVVVLNFTLQFVPPTDRLALLQSIHHGLNPGGILILSEKLASADTEAQQWMDKHHTLFKRAQGYSDLEIAQKRAAIENVLIPDTAEAHHERLAHAGFSASHQWFHSFNFASFVAHK
ncbi:carboxy-S-adenosyl-L-methionine synthase CmoA [Salinispirillum sp. LH 10-3-1]|uniref:Carboxy-S-adenosyl-L-methionine synthase n=1 Tax=Salinispirillum sp. LH 10-3-1 TaxID=2952525 RepID=A0AB38YDE7_9GAMM